MDIISREEVRDKIGEIREADILVGIPSFNNARTIGHVVSAVQAGFAKYFPNRKCVLVNSDGGSADGTAEIVQNTSLVDFQSILIRHRTEQVFKITTPYHGIPGKGSAFRTIFEIARALNAKACAVVDSDLRSITPEWVELLIKPLIEGDCDYVSPLYHRHKYDGTITNGIIYPLTRALYGKRIRQPIGGDFGFSGRLASYFLTKEVWETDVARYGIDIWMTTTAIANDFKVSQAFLGAKIHDPKDPGGDLSEMLYQPVQVNLDRMISKFSLGVEELEPIWRGFLSEKIMDVLKSPRRMTKEDFHIADDVWVEIICSFAIAAHKGAINKVHLLKSLTPLYIGRTASFVRETWESDAAEVESKIEGLCRLFEEEKPFLLENWE